jgi:GT2 family glycosyltransferase
MANYNGLKIGVLSESIASVLKSHFSDFELIVVDNGSTDGSADFLKNIARHDRRVRLLSKSRNTGYSAANKFAVEFARGEFLGFLHNDTRVNSDWLDELLRVIDSDIRMGAVQPQIRDIDNLPIILSEGNLIDRLGSHLQQHACCSDVLHMRSRADSTETTSYPTMRLTFAGELG